MAADITRLHWETMRTKHEFLTDDRGDLWRYPSPAIDQVYYGHLHNGVLIRENYSRHHSTIDTVADFKATLRAGPYVWPGGYPLFFITSDGGALSFESARECAYEIMHSIRHGINDGWRVVACEVNYEDSDLYCDHSGKPIESAYGEAE